MVTLVSSNATVSVRTDEQRGYDVGFGRGTLDKCSGVEARALDGIAETDYNAGYVNGYLDGYCSNDAEM